MDRGELRGRDDHVDPGLLEVHVPEFGRQGLVHAAVAQLRLAGVAVVAAEAARRTVRHADGARVVDDVGDGRRVCQKVVVLPARSSKG